jgi:hypothetical protein
MFPAVILIHPVLASYDTLYKSAFWAGATFRKRTSLLGRDGYLNNNDPFI